MTGRQVQADETGSNRHPYVDLFMALHLAKGQA